ncbi:DHHW family protein [Sporosarcina siberiensis]|uniref:DHHW family protein n=1 Tax=Sporosarcina siberiensis TaxID=1365606 RepID=A0ABW4SHF0_9BACL
MNILNRIVIGIFLCFIGGISFMHIFTKDIRFSEGENRVLSTMPKFTVQSLVSGKFTKDFEIYLSDQFVKKEFWTGLKASAEKTTLKQENNGVYFGKDGYLLERFESPGEQLMKNIISISTFTKATNEASSYLMVVPTSIEMYPEKLPLFAQTDSQYAAIEEIKENLTGSIKWIDAYKSLKRLKNEDIYFRTDHHWTTRGAYGVYKNIAEEMDFEPYEIDDFTIETVSTNFYGTYYSKANDHSIKADTIELFKPKFTVSYHVEIEDSESTMNSLYNLDYLNKRDQYSLFLDGNHSKVKIVSSMKNGRKLLIVKDSYAHAMVPFLANHFEEIHMIDLRYYHSSLNEYVKNNDITNTLFLYNIVTFSEDTNLIWLRQ